VGLGMLVAAWSRWRLEQNDPAAWAWPMAAALAAAPVIYPWYLLYFTPFLFSIAALPLMVWTMTVIPTYIVWELAQQGARWVVPIPVMAWEYGIVLVVSAIVYWQRRMRTQPNPAERRQILSNSAEP